MPELPEVEQFRRYFECTSVDRRVASVRVLDSRILRGCTPQSLGRALHGLRFRSSRRRGKYLIAETDGKWQLIFHFGMTGSFHFSTTPPREFPRTVVRFHFADGSVLSYLSLRLLGQIRLTTKWQTEKEIAKLGPEPLDPQFSPAEFLAGLQNRNAGIKTVLMSQTFVAGIGNLYSDEILFQTQLHPLKRISNLSDEEIGGLYRTMRRVLRLVVARNADAERYPSRYLFAHRSVGNPCPRCKSPLTSLRIGDRTTILCSHCQPLTRPAQP